MKDLTKLNENVRRTFDALRDDVLAALPKGDAATVEALDMALREIVLMRGNLAALVALDAQQ